jgi:hypothetical protein
MSLSFGEEAIPRFREIQADAAGAPLTRAAFAKLPAVQRLMGVIPDAEPEVLAEYLSTLFVVFSFWSVDGTVHPVDRAALDAGLGTAPRRFPAVPKGACYLQLPERWFWMQVHEGGPHEPLDGIVVAGPAHPPQDRDEISVLAAAGLRADRDGFTQVALTATPQEFSAAAGELRQPPFAPLMDGGERAGFRSIASPAELLHVAHVALLVAVG